MEMLHNNIDKFINNVFCDDCLKILQKIPPSSIDLVVTSPPYDNLRNYQKTVSWNFDIFCDIAIELKRVLKKGGVIVWIVNGQTNNETESCTSFKQALFFKENLNLNLHDTIIYAKNNYVPLTNNRYRQQFEYMFVFSKGKPKTFNPIMVNCKYYNTKKTTKYICGSTSENSSYKSGTDRIYKIKKQKIKPNIWYYSVGRNHTSKDDIFKHPATFPELLAEEHILSWSNESDLILDLFAGSGTTLKMALLNNRNYIGIEKNLEYIEIVNEKIKKYSKNKQICNIEIFLNTKINFKTRK